MIQKLLLLLLACLNIELSNIQAQTTTYQWQVYNQQTQQPIPNVHLFMVNTTYGTISDEQGNAQLTIPDHIQQDLLVTHLAYEPCLLMPKEYAAAKTKDTIWLQPSKVNIEQIEVTAGRSNKWKKRYKQFKKSFLGPTNLANKCTILNPEVLRFEEKEGQLIATATDLLQIKNDYLGYQLGYWLNHLTIAADGSTEYLGKARFLDKLKDGQIKNRKTVYQESPKHFFQQLLQNRLAEAGYEIAIAKYEAEQFFEFQTPNPDKLLKKMPNGNYRLYFPEFLKVVNKNIKSVNFETVGVRSGGLESQRFSGTRRQENQSVEYATSYLYKIDPYIELDELGNVLNSKQVKEYGFWADQRVAVQLPFDYGKEYIATTTEQAKTNHLTDEQKLIVLTSLIQDIDARQKKQVFETIEKKWELDFIPPLIEVLRLSSEQWVFQQTNDLLQQKTGQALDDYYDWLQWLWEQDPIYRPYYTEFKALLYNYLDPPFKKYFEGRHTTAIIRMDEIVWGGVKQDGIPPLRHPKMITAKEADYLSKEDVIFGMYINGIAKAYPKRILAWHEFFVDDFNKTIIAGVYCTLCGTVIAYDMEDHQLGTSGFLYRSNKLMYDQATQSLWNTIEGKPVLGPLAGKGIELATHPVITTTWGAWQKQHPDSKVLSLKTGHYRNYDEGAAYASYFATDDLMFPVPKSDIRLKNKDEVLIVRTPNYRTDPLAISINYLKRKGWHQGQIANTSIIVVADKTGAARAYQAKGITFDSYKKGQLKDKKGQTWIVTEDYLQSPFQRRLERLPAHNIFWFAWVNSYPATRLVK